MTKNSTNTATQFTDPGALNPCLLKNMIDHCIAAIVMGGDGPVMSVETPDGLKTAWHNRDLGKLRELRAVYSELCPDSSGITNGDGTVEVSTAVRGFIRSC